MLYSMAIFKRINSCTCRRSDTIIFYYENLKHIQGKKLSYNFMTSLTYLNVDGGSFAPKRAVRWAGSSRWVTSSLGAQVPWGTSTSEGTWVIRWGGLLLRLRRNFRESRAKREGEKERERGGGEIDRTVVLTWAGDIMNAVHHMAFGPQARRMLLLFFNQILISLSLNPIPPSHSLRVPHLTSLGSWIGYASAMRMERGVVN